MPQFQVLLFARISTNELRHRFGCLEIRIF